jgi:hypothetical protein
MGHLILVEDGRFLVCIRDSMIKPDLRKGPGADLVARFWKGEIRRGALGRMPKDLRPMWARISDRITLDVLREAPSAQRPGMNRTPVPEGHQMEMHGLAATGEGRKPDEAFSPAQMAAPEGIAGVKVGQVRLRKPGVLVLHWTLEGLDFQDRVGRALKKSHGEPLRVQVLMMIPARQRVHGMELFRAAQSWAEGWSR